MTSADRAHYEEMGPTLLAAEPPTAPGSDRVAGVDWMVYFGHLEGRRSAMRSWRWSWWSHWAQLAEYIIPERYHWLVVANRMTRGSPLNQAIVDCTATDAMEVCAAGLWSGLTSPSRPWFKMTIGLPWIELGADAKDWLEDTEQRLNTVLSQSNFYTTMAQLFRDVVVFGTSPMVIYEDHQDIIRCYLPCCGEYYLSAGARGSVDTFYREFTLTISQIVEMFGLDACPPDVKDMWQTGGGSVEGERIVGHAIEPNFAIDGPGHKNIRVVPGSFPYREVYWLVGTQTSTPLSVRGFHEKPFAVARWSVRSNDPYGRSPGMKALGDIKQLQIETRRKAEFLEKLVRPPMGADPELKNEPSSILPGSITYVSTGPGKKFAPLFEVNPAALAPMVLDIEKISARIKDAFYVNIFMAITQMEGVQPRNELELTKRDLERLQVLGPFIELFESDLAGPALLRILSIMRRRQMLKEMPQSLKGVPIKLQYNSILRMAQIAMETANIKDVLATAGSLSAAAKAAGVPDPIRVINLDAAMRKYTEISNFPSSAVWTPEEVDEHDKARQQVQAQQQAVQTSMAGVQAAKTLSDTQLGPGSALSSLMGGP